MKWVNPRKVGGKAIPRPKEPAHTAEPALLRTASARTVSCAKNVDCASRVCLGSDSQH